MAITGVSRLLVDTNVLVYAADANSPFHNTAAAVLEQALHDGIELVITPQILREFMVASLRGFPDPAQAPYDDIVADAEEFRSTFKVLTENTQTVQELGALIRQYRVYGKSVHDANLVAAMRVHGLHDLLTHNTQDFARFADLITVHPLLASGLSA